MMKGNALKTSLIAGASLLAFGAAFVAMPHQAKAATDRPLYAVQPIPRAANMRTNATTSTLPTWTFNWSYNGSSGAETFVGNEPTAGAATAIPVVIIPIKTVFTTKGGKTVTADPLAIQSGSGNVIQSILNSPIFQNQDYNQGGTDVGNTQYIDAFERASLWYGVASNSAYHVTFATPKVMPEITFNVPGGDGFINKDFGYLTINAFLTWWDNKIQRVLKYNHLPSGTLPIFISANTYLTELPHGYCCVGGYHSYNGTNSYSFATYMSHPGVFAQDVSALSHELGEWIQDPYTNNSGCGGLWEVGDPLEGNANYGGYPYTMNGFTYNLQDLVTPPYFGAAPSTSVNDWSTFQGETLTVCQNGQ